MNLFEQAHNKVDLNAKWESMADTAFQSDHLYARLPAWAKTIMARSLYHY